MVGIVEEPACGLLAAVDSAVGCLAVYRADGSGGVVLDLGCGRTAGVPEPGADCGPDGDGIDFAGRVSVGVQPCACAAAAVDRVPAQERRRVSAFVRGLEDKAHADVDRCGALSPGRLPAVVAVDAAVRRLTVNSNGGTGDGVADLDADADI